MQIAPIRAELPSIGQLNTYNHQIRAGHPLSTSFSASFYQQICLTCAFFETGLCCGNQSPTAPAIWPRKSTRRRVIGVSGWQRLLCITSRCSSSLLRMRLADQTLLLPSLQPVCFKENEKQHAESVEQKLESKVTETTHKGGVGRRSGPQTKQTPHACICLLVPAQ